MTPEALQELCESGQEALMRMDYVRAEALLTGAELWAWEARDWDTLSRLYMPLQETRRQLKERRKNFSRRIEAIERIQQAASGLDERIAEIDAHEQALTELDGKLDELTDQLVRAPASPHEPVVAPSAAALTQAA